MHMHTQPEVPFRSIPKDHEVQPLSITASLHQTLPPVGHPAPNISLPGEPNTLLPIPALGFMERHGLWSQPDLPSLLALEFRKLTTSSNLIFPYPYPTSRMKCDNVCESPAHDRSFINIKMYMYKLDLPKPQA